MIIRTATKEDAAAIERLRQHAPSPLEYMLQAGKELVQSLDDDVFMDNELGALWGRAQ